MAEQIPMDFESAPESQTVQTAESINELLDNGPNEYEPLDTQLASLFQELNGEAPENKAQNAVIKTCTLEISKHTREGQIAIPISASQQETLLQTHVAGKAGDYTPLIIDQGYLYLRRYWQYQQRLADQIQSRLEIDQQIDEATPKKSETHEGWIRQRLDDYFPQEDDEINWQRRATELALKHQFLIVSGGPGTGKTTTITRLLALLIEQSLKSGKKVGGVLSDSEKSFKVLLAAPTGKAAIRMLDSIRQAQSQLDLPENVSQQMPSEASTIHKMLGYQHGSVTFKHNHKNPLNADVVLVDEASMIDIALMSKLVEAVPAHAKLILIGDKDQLSSVETGSVFADMCRGLANAESEHLVTLKKNWRFAADSDIGQSAIAANTGDSATLLSVLKKQNACELISPETIRDADLIKPWQSYFEVLNKPNASHAEIFAAFDQYRILCALRRGLNGSVIMNERIETALNKQGFINLKRHASSHNQSNQSQSAQNSSWYHGRPVMITQNSYGKGLFNGDTGIALIQEGEVKVWFPSEDGAFKSFSPVRLPAHETTWAMTIHKSQGSEFNQVVLILPHEEMPLLTRQLIYTGITRAKEQVRIVASEGVLVAGVRAEVVEATLIDKKVSVG